MHSSNSRDPSRRSRSTRTKKSKPATAACGRVSQLFSIVFNYFHSQLAACAKTTMYGIFFRSRLLPIMNLHWLQQLRSWPTAFFSLVRSQTNEAEIPSPNTKGVASKNEVWNFEVTPKSFINFPKFFKKDSILHSHDWKCLNFWPTSASQITLRGQDQIDKFLSTCCSCPLNVIWGALVGQQFKYI